MIKKLYLIEIALLLLGVFIALVSAPLVLISINTLQALWDTANPPATMRIHSAQRAGDTLKLQFAVTRHRPCTFNQFTGFSGPGYSDMHPGTLSKEDGSPTRNYPVGITVISPTWLMTPFFGPHILLYGDYDCAGKPVRALVIDQGVP